MVSDDTLTLAGVIGLFAIIVLACAVGAFGYVTDLPWRERQRRLRDEHIRRIKEERERP